MAADVRRRLIPWMLGVVTFLAGLLFLEEIQERFVVRGGLMLEEHA